MASLAERFWAKVNKLPGRDACWEWTAAKYGYPGNQYGSLKVSGRNVGAHRVSWLLHNPGEIPSGIEVCHTCDNGICVRPSHLFLGTRSDNQRDAVSKGRHVRPLPPTDAQRARGERHGLSKATEADVRRIRKLYATGRSVRSLANEFDLGWATVDKIVKRITWRHVA